MKRFVVLLAALTLAFPPAVSAQAEMLRVFGLIGPTGMSLAPMMAAEPLAYDIRLAASPEEMVGTIVSGGYDIAAIPTNLAALLYQKTGGQLQMLAINTLGVLYVLESGDSVRDASGLSGRTITLSGQGAVPEYALNYVLAANGIKDAALAFRGEHNEVSSLAASGLADLVMLPQPMATALMMKEPAFRVALDLTVEFQKAAALMGKPEARLSMGCLVVRSGFALQNPEALEAFLSDYEAAVRFVNREPAAAAEHIVQAGILPGAAIAEKAIPLCSIVCIRGREMRESLSPLFEVLFEANPASVGGALPDDAFYYGLEN